MTSLTVETLLDLAVDANRILGEEYDLHELSGAPRITAGMVRVGKLRIRAWNLFNCRTRDGYHYWGAGILQINGRHLLYVGHEFVSVLFVRWQRRPQAGAGGEE